MEIQCDPSNLSLRLLNEKTKGMKKTDKSDFIKS